MARVFLALLLAVTALAGCGVLRSTYGPDSFVVFFSPGRAELSPEGLQIVRQAAAEARQRKPSKIEIALPADAPGSVNLFEARITAIRNVLSEEGTTPDLVSTRSLPPAEIVIPGAEGRGEIRLIR